MIINDLFYVERGRGDYKEKYNEGTTPLVSATNENNGILDFVDSEPTFKSPSITVERVTGQAFVQLNDFVTVPDDMTVLIPKIKMSLRKMFFIAAQINLLKWKFCYSRKLTPKRLKVLEIDLSNFEEGKINLSSLVPEKNKKKKIDIPKKFDNFQITELFYISRGDFHALDKLDEGKIPTVSRITLNNGIVGYFELPNEAKLYKKGTITISTSSGDAFVQLHDFIATDNVLICKPKKDFKITTLFFIQLALNKFKWRFSYGRQCYKRIFSKTVISLPTNKNKEIDEDFMEKIVKNCYGWNEIESFLK